jgi:hypothetical protein
MARRRSFAKPRIKGRAARERYGEGCIGKESIGHAVGGEKRNCDRREKRRSRDQGAKSKDTDQRARAVTKKREQSENTEQRTERRETERRAEITIAWRKVGIELDDSADIQPQN